MKLKDHIILNIGFLLVAVGVCSADSEILIIPTILAVVGSVLMLIESKKFEDEEQEDLND